MKSKIILLSVIGLLLFGACTEKKKNNTQIDLIPKVAAPLQLGFDRTLIYLDDYISDSLMIDSVTINNKKVDYYQNKRTILFTSEEKDSLPFLMEMKIWAGGHGSCVVLKKSKKRHFLFVFDPMGKTYNKIEIAGEFNGWVPSKTPLTQNDGKWGKMLLLNEGKYQYQLVLDGKWKLNPNDTIKVDNGQGGYNSVLSIGAKKDKNPVLLTHSFTANSITIKTKNNPKEFFILWDNIRLDSSYYKISEGKLEIQLPDYAVQKQRSFIRIFSYNNSGTSNDILIPLENGSPFNSPKKLKKNDFQTNIIYNVFVDRFYDGDKTNNWRLPDSIVLPPANYLGGDIKGVIQKIEDGYFNELGVNTLWLSPVIRNTEGAYGYWPEPETKFSAYHGYWPVSFNKIDRHFGTADDLKNLTSTAHRNNENIILDFVANHVHQEHPYYKAHPDCATELMLPDGTKNLERWDEYRLTTWFDTFLPTLNLEKSEIAEMLTDSIIWWANEYDLDGFRYDAAKHIPLSFWRLLTKKLKKENTKTYDGNLYQLGETYGSPELIGSYISNGLLDAQFDFNVYDAALQAFAAGKSFNTLAQRLQESLIYYGSHNLMGYITGNQDRGRFISYAGGSLKFDEDPKAAGWTRDIEVGDSIGYQKLQMLMAFNMTIPGNPVIYYGDEFGMPGGNDPDCRRMMRFGNELNEKEKKNLEITQLLTKLRKENLALTYGDFCYFSPDNHTLVYARKYFNNVVIVAFNNSNETKKVEIDASLFTDNYEFAVIFGDNYKIINNKIIIELAPWSFTVLKQD